jgi:hypothetical protein
MARRDKLSGRRLLLGGSKSFRGGQLPAEVREKIDEAIDRKMTIIVGEAPGANRLYQDYLKSRGYAKVIVGHAKSIRYNAGKWPAVPYGNDVHERETNMIEDCDSAIIIWADPSGVIAENLEILKRRGKPTFLYEYSSQTGRAKSDWLDPKRVYDHYYYWKEYMRSIKGRDKKH